MHFLKQISLLEWLNRAATVCKACNMAVITFRVTLLFTLYIIYKLLDHILKSSSGAYF